MEVTPGRLQLRHSNRSSNVDSLLFCDVCYSKKEESSCISGGGLIISLERGGEGGLLFCPWL